MYSIVRERHSSDSAITYVLITEIDGAASEICGGPREWVAHNGVVAATAGEWEKDVGEVRLAGGLIKVV